MSKKSNKEQGKHVSGAGMSDDRQIRDPRTLGRGIGSSFAEAVSKLIDEVDSFSGSKNGFLGVEKKKIDEKENLHSSILPKEHNASKKLME